MKLRIFLALALLALLTGCESNTLAKQVKEVQDKAVELCAYLPSFNSVSAILTAGNPTAIGINAVANAICTAVIQWKDHQTNALVTDCPRVNGVCVQGQFVQPKEN